MRLPPHEHPHVDYLFYIVEIPFTHDYCATIVGPIDVCDILYKIDTIYKNLSLIIKNSKKF